MTPEGLPAAWAALVGDVPGARAAGAWLLAAYGEAHRRYHDRRHLAEVLTVVDDLAGCAADLDAVRLAAWFHDAVYDPRAGDNEMRSAELATRALAGLGVATGRVSEVARLVRVTRAHDPGEDDPDGAVLCDADLAVLAGGARRYAAYVAGVRAEYHHLDDATFAAGRASVLRSLLSMPRLFRTGPGRERYEAAARANLRGELSRLAGVLSPGGGAVEGRRRAGG